MKQSIEQQLAAFKRKYYFNLILKGSILTIAILVSIYIFVTLLEYFLFLDSTFRAFLLFGYLILSAYIFIKWILVHVTPLLLKSRAISDEQAASKIGTFFPLINDKLLNIIQLKSTYFEHKQDLILAGINQKTNEISGISFENAVDLRENLQYLKYLLFPFIVLLLIAILSPNVLVAPTKRIVQFNKSFEPQAPFQFNVSDTEFIAFRNEDFKFQVELTGKSYPEDVYMVSEGRRLKLKNPEGQNYFYTFEKVQHSRQFELEAAGYSSSTYTLKVVNRPQIQQFDVLLQFPIYLYKQAERISNAGNLQIPEGTEIKWFFNVSHADSVWFSFKDDSIEHPARTKDSGIFEYERSFYADNSYEVILKNAYGSNNEKLLYKIDVLPDKYPKISVEQIQDTIAFRQLVLGGSLRDDYGLTDLKLFYKIIGENNQKPEKYNSIDIDIDRSKAAQSYYFTWNIQKLKLQNGDQLEYFLQVRDNDGISGPKPSRTPVFQLKLPEKKQIKEQIEGSTKSTENQIDKSLQEAKELKENLEELESRMKGKKKMSWEDEQLLKKVMEQKENIEQEISKLQQQFEQNQQMRDRFDPEKDKRIEEKVEQLQELMEELLDEETKKLYEELEKLLQENSDPEQLQEMIEELNFKEENLEKELERTLELFKRMKFEYKLDEVIEETQSLEEQQEDLAEKNENKEGDTENLEKKQQELNESFEELEKDIEELQNLNQDLKNPELMQSTQEEQEEIKELQKEALEQMQKGKHKKSSQSQKDAAQKMRQMNQKMQQMQASMEMMQMQENLDDLRDILDNLLKLSFDEEELMKEFRKVNQTDPRFIELSQNQLKLRDDAQIVEDSLMSLAKRVFQISSFVTREVGDMNRNMDDAVEAIKERRKAVAVGKQQYVMTSINNLALLLDDVMNQMQQAMADAMGNPRPGDQKQQSLPSMIELQKRLSQQIQELKRSGKQGRQLSEELARMAAEQERLRKAMEEMNQKLKNQNRNGQGGLEDVIDKMEENEIDLVNKRLTENTIKRQQDILTRLLEAEKAMREQQLDKERKGETARDYSREIPEAFEEYIKQKEKEIELLKTIPPKLNPYYKEQVNQYFERLEK